MGRSASQPVNVPGAPAPDTAGSAEEGNEGTAVNEPLPVQSVSASGAVAVNVAASIPQVDPAARIAELEAKVAVQAEENERLRAASAAAGDENLPKVVFEPETPHGKAALEASATRGMTVAQVMQAIDEKRLPEPTTSYLCADGYYSRRA